MQPLCITCKGKGLCGKPCPIIQRLKTYYRAISKIDNEFSGTSPSVFVGRYGYPNVAIGILSPPEISSEAWKLDAPELWYQNNYTIENVIETRSQLINSKTGTNIKGKSKVLDIAQEISMAKQAEVEFLLKKKPIPKISLDIRMPPIGAPAVLENAKITDNPKIPRKIDAIVNDELKAKESVNLLYEKGVEVNQIMKILSVGLLGIDKKLVPTRWAITATDDMISQNLIKEIKDYPIINDYLLFSNEYLGNHFEILLIPREWNFEVLEAETPKSTWNPSKRMYIMVDWERNWGRKYYADNVTGAYYSDRLAVCEYLKRIRRQASVLIVREVKPEYMIPCGVWVNREAVRGAFTKTPEKFSDLETALKTIFSRVNIPKEAILNNSHLLKEIKMQKRLIQFLK